MSGARLRSVDGVVREMASLGAAAPLDGGGEPPHDGDMDARVAKLEAIVPTLATKADVEGLRADFHKGTNELIKWVVGTSFVGIALFVTIMTFVLNNAIPKAAVQPQQQPAPIIIQVPSPPPVAAPVLTPAKP